MGVQNSNNAGMAEQHERDPTRLYRPTMSTLYKFELGEFAEQSEGMAQQQQQQQQVVGRESATESMPPSPSSPQLRNGQFAER